MKKLWIQWAGGKETRDDGFVIYKDPRFTLLRSPDGKLEQFRTVSAAKAEADRIVTKTTKGA